jgi:hypothetical protein
VVGDLQFLVAGGNGPVLLEAIDQPFDGIALAVGGAIEADAAPRFGAAAGNDGPDVAAAQVGSLRSPRLTLVAGDPIRPHPGPTAAWALDRAGLQQGRHLAGLVALARSQDGADRLAAPLGAEVDFRRKPATGAAERLIAAPFLAPAACWWARTVVPSRKCSVQSKVPPASPADCSAASTRSQTPACCQRRKREYTVCQGPYRSGRSRQGAPVRKRQRMALSTVRWSLAGRPVTGRCGGSSGRSRSHCPSVSSCRRTIHQRYYPFANTP